MTSLRAMLILFAAQAVLSAGAFAQVSAPNGGASPMGTRPMADVPSPAAPRPEPSDIVFLPDAEGKLVPVPKDATLQEFLAWRKRRPVAVGDELRFSVSSLTFDGEADDERAQLTAVARVQVYDDATWVNVPLQLNEAVLRNVDHKGPGEHSFAGIDRELGHRWWLRGKGLHELTLSLGIPVRRQGPTRRLQLNLPVTAVSTLVLRVPVQATSTKVLPDTAWVRTQSDGGRSTVEVRGLGTRFDLSWQPLAATEPTETVLQSESTLDATVTGDSVVLVADQAVEALQGSFQELRVRLPEGFELLDVEERQGRLASWMQPEGTPQLVILKLVEPTKGPLSLHWTLERQFPETGGPLTIDGFEVEQALRQSGEIVLSAADGYRITRREGEDRFVYRSQSRRLATAGRNASSWRFLKQPFRLVVDVLEAEPYFTVEPQLAVHCSDEEAELDAVFKYHVATDRGAVREVLLRWPGWRDEGWVLQPVDAPGLVEQMQADEKTGQIRVRLASRRIGTFSLPLKASRPVVVNGEPFDFTLPAAITSSRTLASVRIDCDPNLEATVRPAGLPESNEPPRWSRDWMFHADASSLAFRARITMHPQRVRCESTTEISVPSPDQLQVVQRLSFDVAYEPLSQVRLLVPSSLEGRVTASLPGGTALPMSPTGVETAGRRQHRLTLPAPRLGKFEIQVAFALSLPADFADGRPTAVSAPVIQSSDGDLTTTHVRFRRSGEFEATVGDGAFQPRVPDELWTSWIAAGAQSEIPLTLNRSFATLSSSYSIGRTWVRTQIDANGWAASRGWYEVDGAPQTVIVLVPASLKVSGFGWDGRRLAADRIRESGTDLQEYRLAVEGALEPARHLLTIDFQSIDGSPLRWGQSHRFDAPRFPDAVWVRQSAWEVVLPEGQHLLGCPVGYTPQHRWVRSGFHWERRVPAAFDGPKRWIAELSRDAGADDLSLRPSNVYVLTRLGPAHSLSASTIGFPMLVLAGAGMAWAAGFLLLKAPATRNVLTLLSLGLLIAAIGLWQADALELLVQPAAVGLLLALAMAAIERFVSGDRTPAVLTIPGASDVGRSTPSSLNRMATPAVESLSQPPRSASREVIAPTGAGSAR